MRYQPIGKNHLLQGREKTKEELAKNKVFFTFGLIYLLFMTSRAIFNPYVTVYLQEKGFAAEKIGLITGANSLVLIIAQPFWGIVTDKIRSTKYTLVICMFLQAAFSFAMVYGNTFLVIAAFFCAYGFFSSPEGPLLDTWCLKSLKEVGRQNSVGQMKFLGCFGYAACSILSGYVISKYDTTKILPVFSAVLIAIGTWLLFMRINVREEKAVSIRELSLTGIVKDKRFLLFLAVVFFMQIPHRAAYTFYPLLISHLGGDKVWVGYTSAVMFLSEGVFMFCSKKLLNRFRAGKVIILSGLFFVVWQLLYSVVSLPWQVTAIAVLDGPSYALFTIGVLYYLDEIAPESTRTTYQTITYAVYFGLSGITGNSLGGFIIEVCGFRVLYLTGAAVVCVSILFLYLMDKRGKSIRSV